MTTPVTADPAKPTPTAAIAEMRSTATDEGVIPGALAQADNGPGPAVEGSAAGAAVGVATEVEAAASSQRIVWDAAALERLLDRSALEARHAASLAAGEDGEAQEGEEEDGQDDLMRAFKVGRTGGGGAERG